MWLWHKIKNSTKRAARMTCAAARAFRLRVGKKCTGRQREEEKKKKKKKRTGGRGTGRRLAARRRRLRHTETPVVFVRVDLVHGHFVVVIDAVRVRTGGLSCCCCVSVRHATRDGQERQERERERGPNQFTAITREIHRHDMLHWAGQDSRKLK